MALTIPPDQTGSLQAYCECGFIGRRAGRPTHCLSRDAVITKTHAIYGLILLLTAPAYADGIRDFSPNRPSRSNSPFTVPTGRVQIEMDLANYTHPEEVLQTLDPTVLYGLTNRIDIEASIGGLIRQRDDKTTSEGFGDVYIRAKFNLVGDDGGPFTVAVIPNIKIPTAPQPIGNGQVEGGVNVPVMFSLPFGLDLSVEPEISVLKADATNGRQESFTGIVNLERKLVGGLSGFVEIYDQTFTGSAASSPALTFDYGLAYLVTKAVQLDVGANVGLNHATPALNIYSGLAFRF